MAKKKRKAVRRFRLQAWATIIPRGKNKGKRIVIARVHQRKGGTRTFGPYTGKQATKKMAALRKKGKF